MFHCLRQTLWFVVAAAADDGDGGGGDGGGDDNNDDDDDDDCYLWINRETIFAFLLQRGLWQQSLVCCICSMLQKQTMSIMGEPVRSFTVVQCSAASRHQENDFL